MRLNESNTLRHVERSLSALAAVEEVDSACKTDRKQKFCWIILEGLIIRGRIPIISNLAV